MESQKSFARNGADGASLVVIAAAGLVALAVAMGVGRFAFTPILPLMQREASLSIPEASWLATANYLGYLVGALSLTAWRVRAGRAIRAGLATVGVATAAMGLTADFGSWLLLRSVAGTASAWVLISTASWTLGRLAPAGSAQLTALVFSGVGVGIAAVGSTILVLMAADAASSIAWISLGIASLVLTALLWPVFEDSSDENAPPGGGSWTGTALLFVVAYGALGFGYIVPATFLPAEARRAVPDPLLFGWVWPLFGAAAALSTFVVAGLRRTMSDRALWARSYIAMAAGVALPAVWHELIAILIAALLVGGTLMVSTMVALRAARALSTPDPTQLIAAMTAAFASGQVAGPVLAGQLHGLSGDFSVSLLSASFVLVVTAIPLARGNATAQRAEERTR